MFDIPYNINSKDDYNFTLMCLHLPWLMVLFNLIPISDMAHCTDCIVFVKNNTRAPCVMIV